MVNFRGELESRCNGRLIQGPWRLDRLQSGAGIWIRMYVGGSGAEVKVCICLQIAGLPEDITGSTAAECVSPSVHNRRCHRHKYNTGNTLGPYEAALHRTGFMLSTHFRPWSFLYVFTPAGFRGECFQSRFFFFSLSLSRAINCFRSCDTGRGYEYMNIYTLLRP